MSQAVEPPEPDPNPATPMTEKDAPAAAPLGEEDAACRLSAPALDRGTGSSVTDSALGDAEDHTMRKRPWHPRVTPWSEIVAQDYKGAGTEAEPYIVSWLKDDPENPMGYKQSYKWFITVMAATGTLAVSMGSSMLSAAVEDIKRDFPGHNTMLYIMVTGESPIPITLCQRCRAIRSHSEKNGSGVLIFGIRRGR